MTTAGEDALPHSASSYAWRWSDAAYNVLPPDVLISIQTLRPAAARALGSRMVQLRGLAVEPPTSTIDAVAADRDEVDAWLGGLPIAQDSSVLLFWSFEDAVQVRWQHFTAYWDDFWYPSSDDLEVVPDGEPGILTCRHYGEFSWRRLPAETRRASTDRRTTR